MADTEAPATSTPSENGETPIYLETAQYHGHPTTVARDPEGHIVYPAYVPPAAQSPDTILSPTSQTDSQSQPPTSRRRAESDGETGAGPRKAQTEPAVLQAPTRPNASVQKRWVTEMPRRGERRQSALPPSVERARTNISMLSRALSHMPSGTGAESSSSGESSSDEEDEHGDSLTQGGSKPKPQHRQTDDEFRRFKVGNEHYRTKGKVSKRDGRLNITVKDTSNTGYLAKALGTAVRKAMPLTGEKVGKEEEARRPSAASRLSAASTTAGVDSISCPRLNIVIMVIGSRGDAQPFLKIGKQLKEQYGHRVRIATHPAFREFVEKDSGLEFFSVGGDPSELMAFMVKNPGMIPSLESVKAGDIGRRRSAMAEMFEGFWRACINATDDEKDVRNLKMMGAKDPFVADAIIANPPSFAHIHCAEALGIPLHLMFTFPYTPTQAFPHPLASIKKSNVDPGYTNFISYPLVEMMVWQGLGDLVNDFRVKTLGLDPVSTLWAPGATYRLHVPFTYMWSPGLVPKPEDWGSEIDVSGFVFLDLASSFKPPDPLTEFLKAGEDPIYIGFGSIVVDDADRFTQMIFEAVKLAGVRALVSKGWGGLGGDSLDVPDNIFLLDNTPHDWLFPRVRACVIHGGAGTTAIALKCGKPTMIVPFFGDQHFWGAMVSNAKAGPEAVPYKHLTAEKLADGIKYCLTEEAVRAAEEIARRIEEEGDGAANACESFHKHLTLSGKNSMRCSILQDRVAVWQLKNTNVRLSAMAADLVVESGYASWRKLRLLRHNEWNDFEGPGEPVTGAAGSLMSSFSDVFSGIGGVPYRIAKLSNKRQEKKLKRLQMRRQLKQERKLAAKKKAQNGGANGPEGEQELPDIQTTTTNALNRSTTNATVSTAPDGNMAEDFVTQVGRGAYKSASALARAPVDLSLALAQGFHNAPRLYGDDTVRRPPRVTGIRSGLTAARREFGYGVYDGFTGLVRLPVRGAKEGGVRGFVSGIGMGVTGLVLKDIAALIGPVGYTLKGFTKQIDRGRQPIRYIRRARIVQGQREVRMLDEARRKQVTAEVARGWGVMSTLWVELEAEEKRKGGLRRRLGAKRRRGLGAEFESVEVAERTLEAVRKGEGEKSVIGKDRGRKAVDAGKRSADESKAKKKEKDSKTAGLKKEPSAAGLDAKKRSTARTSLDGERPSNDFRGTRFDEPAASENISEVDEGASLASGKPKDGFKGRSSFQEQDNPFGANDCDIAKNKEVNRRIEEEALNSKA